jgi:VanZ family protein
MKRVAWSSLFSILFLTYFLSSVPNLAVLPVLRQVNAFLSSFDFSMIDLAGKLADRLPAQLGPAKDVASLFYQYAQANPAVAEFMLRKSAHVILFFFITIAFFLLLRQYIHSPWRALFGAAILTTAVACLDEIHQTFVPGRSGNIVDVFINGVGIWLAFLFIAFALVIAGRASGAEA